MENTQLDPKALKAAYLKWEEIKSLGTLEFLWTQEIVNSIISAYLLALEA